MVSQTDEQGSLAEREKALDQLLERLRDLMLNEDNQVVVEHECGVTAVRDPEAVAVEYEVNGTYTFTVLVNGGARDDARAVEPGYVARKRAREAAESAGKA